MMSPLFLICAVFVGVHSRLTLKSTYMYQISIQFVKIYIKENSMVAICQKKKKSHSLIKNIFPPNVPPFDFKIFFNFQKNVRLHEDVKFMGGGGESIQDKTC